MYLVIGKGNNQILAISNTLDYQSNGNPVCDEYAIAAVLVDRIEEVETVPEGVIPDYFAYRDGEYIQIMPLPGTEELTDALNALELLGYTEASNG